MGLLWGRHASRYLKKFRTIVSDNTTEDGLRRQTLRIFALLVVTGACYHATIETGLTPSAQTIEKHWASGWLYGLVPPSPVQTAEKCPGGVAKVDTQLSFANQLVSFLTLGIYSPMDITVTCAEGRTSSLPLIQSGADKGAGFQEAIALSLKMHQPVLLTY